MPQLGETVTEGTVARWLKKPGDSVEKYEAFVEISTDKVNAEVPSPVSGTLREHIAAEGETVLTGAPIAIIDEAGAPAQAPSPAPTANDAPLLPLASTPAANIHASNANGSATAANGTRLSPAVRRLAREHAVNVGALVGTGAHGRVTASDIVAAAAGSAAAPAPAAFAAAPAPPQPAIATPPVVLGELLPLTPARKLIARRMVESKHNAPHAWTMVEVDVTNLWAMAACRTRARSSSNTARN